MRKKTGKKRTIYSPEFKEQAIKLAQELGSAREACEKLGIKHFQTLRLWIRQVKTQTETPSYDELQRLREENKKLRKELEKERKSVVLLRDATAFFLLRETEMKYKGVTHLKQLGHPVREICNLLQVSSSGFYTGTSAKLSSTEQRNKELTAMIGNAFYKHKRAYGYPRIHKELQNQGEELGRRQSGQDYEGAGAKSFTQKSLSP